jgi:CRP/FNR family transcriptional regulator
MLAAAFAPDTESCPEIRRRRPHVLSGADPLAARFDTAPSRLVPAKEHLYCEGDPASHVYRVEAGHIVIFRTMADGRRQVIGFAYPGDILGLGALDEHASHAQATHATIVRCLSVTVLAELAAHNPGVGLRLYEAVSRELMASRELLFSVSQCTALERLASFLVALSRRNEQRGGDPNEIVLPMTRSDIADFLGLTIETVSRTFTRLRVEGMIDLEQCILVTIRDARRLAVAAGTSDRG